MKVLVTGAEGQVGSEVVRLADDAFAVSAFDRRTMDITKRDDVNRRLDEVGPEFVVNCAAYTAVDRAEVEPDIAHAVNADAVRLLGDACAQRGIGIVHLSTDYVFDGRKDGPYVEDDKPNPLGVYGASKLAGEEQLRQATDQHVILRVSWVFGRLGRSFVDTILRLARERAELSVVDDQIGAPSPAAAIALAIREISATVAARKDAWGTYHFTTTPALSWCAFAQRIVTLATHSGLLESAPVVRPIKTHEWSAKAPRPLNSRLDGHKTTTVFGHRPVSWERHLHGYLSSLKPKTAVSTVAPA